MTKAPVTSSSLASAYLVCVLEAAARAVVVLAPALMPHIGAFAAPLVRKLCCSAQIPVLLPPLLLPLVPLTPDRSGFRPYASPGTSITDQSQPDYPRKS